MSDLKPVEKLLEKINSVEIPSIFNQTEFKKTFHAEINMKVWSGLTYTADKTLSGKYLSKHQVLRILERRLLLISKDGSPENHMSQIDILYAERQFYNLTRAKHFNLSFPSFRGPSQFEDFEVKEIFLMEPESFFLTGIVKSNREVILHFKDERKFYLFCAFVIKKVISAIKNDHITIGDCEINYSYMTGMVISQKLCNKKLSTDVKKDAFNKMMANIFLRNSIQDPEHILFYREWYSRNHNIFNIYSTLNGTAISHDGRSDIIVIPMKITMGPYVNIITKAAVLERREGSRVTLINSRLSDDGIGHLENGCFIPGDNFSNGEIQRDMGWPSLKPFYSLGSKGFAKIDVDEFRNLDWNVNINVINQLSHRIARYSNYLNRRIHSIVAPLMDDVVMKTLRRSLPRIDVTCHQWLSGFTYNEGQDIEKIEEASRRRIDFCTAHPYAFRLVRDKQNLSMLIDEGQGRKIIHDLLPANISKVVRGIPYSARMIEIPTDEKSFPRATSRYIICQQMVDNFSCIGFINKSDDMTQFKDFASSVFTKSLNEDVCDFSTIMATENMNKPYKESSPSGKALKLCAQAVAPITAVTSAYQELMSWSLYSPLNDKQGDSVPQEYSKYPMGYILNSFKYKATNKTAVEILKDVVNLSTQIEAIRNLFNVSKCEEGTREKEIYFDPSEHVPFYRIGNNDYDQLGKYEYVFLISSFINENKRPGIENLLPDEFRSFTKKEIMTCLLKFLIEPFAREGDPGFLKLYKRVMSTDASMLLFTGIDFDVNDLTKRNNNYHRNVGALNMRIYNMMNTPVFAPLIQGGLSLLKWDGPDSITYDDGSISVIKNSVELSTEGMVMNHCVGGYTNQIMKNPAIIICHIQSEEGGSTAHLQIDGAFDQASKNLAIRIVEHKGPNNSHPATRNVQLLERYIAKLNKDVDGLDLLLKKMIKAVEIEKEEIDKREIATKERNGKIAPDEMEAAIHVMKTMGNADRAIHYLRLYPHKASSIIAWFVQWHNNRKYAAPIFQNMDAFQAVASAYYLLALINVKREKSAKKIKGGF